MLLMLLGLGAVLLGLVAYWALVLSEGVYLGRGVVTWLYDRAAPRYDQIKNSDPEDDARYLARPLLLAPDGMEEPRILDVATGTGRLPVAVLAEAGFSGQVLGVDRSAAMLREAQRKLAYRPGVSGLLLADAGHLPFASDSFDAVTCLEALEFTACPRVTLAEMIRVLKPGGVLLTSNRIGWDVLWFPGRSCGRGRAEALLQALGMVEVEREAWQVYYDLVWARKGT